MTVQRLLVVAAVLQLSAPAWSQNRDRTISSAPTGRLAPKVHGAVHRQVQRRILARKPVRRPSAVAIEKLVQQPGNREARLRGVTLLRQLNGNVRAGGLKRGVRRGYGASDVEYKGKGVARALGLKTGQSLKWNTRAAAMELKAESAGRVVVTARPHDHYMSALRGAVNRIVKRLAADPEAMISPKEQLRLALAPADMRAEAMAKNGFKLKREARGKELKYRLEVPGEQGLKVYTRVFGPGISTYLPGRGHSQYIHDGKVLDTYSSYFTSLRTTDRIVYPVMLSLKESERMDRLADAIVGGYSRVQGYSHAHGRPKGYWPPRPGETQTGNTCSTTHHRAPVGARKAEYRWLDRLDRAGRSLGVLGSVLRHVSNSNGSERVQIIDGLMARAGGDTRQQLGQLKGIVEQYNRLGLSSFPLDLLGRKQLKALMGTPYDPKRPGTTDPVGPGFARPMYSGATERVPVVVKLKQR